MPSATIVSASSSSTFFFLRPSSSAGRSSWPAAFLAAGSRPPSSSAGGRLGRRRRPVGRRRRHRIASRTCDLARARWRRGAERRSRSPAARQGARPRRPGRRVPPEHADQVPARPAGHRHGDGHGGRRDRPRCGRRGWPGCRPPPPSAAAGSPSGPSAWRAPSSPSSSRRPASADGIVDHHDHESTGRVKRVVTRGGADDQLGGLDPAGPEAVAAARDRRRLPPAPWPPRRARCPSRRTAASCRRASRPPTAARRRLAERREGDPLDAPRHLDLGAVDGLVQRDLAAAAQHDHARRRALDHEAGPRAVGDHVARRVGQGQHRDLAGPERRLAQARRRRCRPRRRRHPARR